METIVLTYKLTDPKKHSIRAKCISHDGSSDIYIHREILEQLGLKYNDKVWVTLSKEDPNVQRS